MENELVIKLHSIPLAVKILFGTVIALNAVWITLLSLGLAVAVFENSIPLGLVLFFTSLGFMTCGAGAGAAWASYGLFENTDNVENPWELWSKNFGLFLLAIIGPWIVYYICLYVTLFLIGVFGHR